MIDKKHWEDALLVQSACNLSGVIKSFERVMEAIREEARALGEGTAWINSHPICILFSTQISHLANAGDLEKYSQAYSQANEIITSQ